MSDRYGYVPVDTVTKAVIADASYIEDRADSADWYLLPYGVGLGWQTLDNGATWVGPNGQGAPAEPTGATGYRYLLTGFEWVESFTENEWRSLKNLSQQDTTAGRRLDQLLDAIKLTNSVDLQSTAMQQFYGYLVAQGWISQARADELQAGIEE